MAETTAWVNGEEVVEDAMVESRLREAFNMGGRSILLLYPS